MNRKKIGIIGGTFDPVHNGHLKAAEIVFEQMDLDELIFIPAYIAPHKVGIETAPSQDRLNMVKLAISTNKKFKCSDIEIKRKGISYTYDTLKALKETYFKEDELFFVIGMDSFLELNTWNNLTGILELATLIVATRPGFEKDVKAFSKSIIANKNNRIKYLNAPGLGISSTEIRDKIQNNDSLEEALPNSVIKYINDQGLYKKKC